MKHKYRLNLAAALIQVLLLTASVSALATAEAEHEIGIPQPMVTPAKGCFGVVLSPDGDGFYSVRDGLLSHYQIDPFKKTGSIAMDESQLKDITEKTECHVLIMDDRSKLIMVFREWIVVLDRRTGVINKKLKREGELRKKGAESFTVNGDDLVFLEKISWFTGNSDHPDVTYRLLVLDARSLQPKKQISDIRERFGFLYSYDGSTSLTKIENRLYLSSGISLVVLNGKTYEPELALSTRAGQVGGIKISKDYRKLYVANVWSIRDYLTKTEKTSASPTEDRDVTFDQDTREISFEQINFNKARHQRDQFDPLLFAPSRNRDYLAVKGNLNTHAVIGRKTANINYSFYPYESGEAILKMTQYPDRKMSFQLTPGARQYLMMKNSTGKLVPINDITFNQYLSTGSQR